MKNIIIVTGGAGFVGSNLIDFLVKNTKFRIISIDNYSSGSSKNHIPSRKVRYIKGDKKMDYPKWVYEIIAKHLQCSMREASEAIDVYELSAGGQAELADILLKYGIEEKEVRKLGLI